MTQPPNVVFVITDDQGYGDLACHGNPVIRTPNLDRMHAESVRFTNYHVGPTCAPTRAGLMTGHYANSAGVWHTIGGRSLLRRHEHSLADAFSANGYATGLFGKWHLGDTWPYRPQDRGFDEVVHHAGGGIGNTGDYWDNSYFDDSYWTGVEHTRYGGYCTDVWFREGMDFIDRHRNEPFFCYIPTNCPHLPLVVEPRFSDPYLDMTPHEERALFYGMIASIDENFGFLRRHLARLGLEDNTILIFMTDNGSATGCDLDAEGFVLNGFNAGMRGKKGQPYDGGHRVPFFVQWPQGGVGGGRDVDVLASHIDFMPTLVDLCGLEVPKGLDWNGRSLAPLLTDDAASADWPDRTIVTDTQRLVYPVKWRQSAVMTDRWRLINGMELHDMEVDPGQTTDLAHLYPDVVRALRADYELWWRRVAGQMKNDIPFRIGDPDCGEVVLTSHDWRNLEVEAVWNQSMVRAGVRYNGYWELDVAARGLYRFELRRWPREANLPLCGSIPGTLRAYGDIAFGTDYGGGAAIAIRAAVVSVGGREQRREVAKSDVSVSFELDLDPGSAHLQTCWETADGSDVGAYYVYLSKVD